jgi:hypothetical protein
MPRTRIVGIFLAVLELVRRGRLRARQDRIFDEIWLELSLPAASATAPPAADPDRPALPTDSPHAIRPAIDRTIQNEIHPENAREIE